MRINWCRLLDNLGLSLSLFLVPGQLKAAPALLLHLLDNLDVRRQSARPVNLNQH